ncbi:MAG: hypothetical protein ACI9WC_002816 [Arenicella sp.]|jgi:hypothetical protein
MDNNNFTEVTSQGWLSRIGGAIKGVFFGLILFIIAFPLLTWNEGRAVDRIKALEEGSGLVVHIESKTINSLNDQKLVHLTADVLTDEILADPVFFIEANAIKLKRTVQTYQWQENVTTRTEKQTGGSEQTISEYSYSEIWSEGLINSNDFKRPEYQNPSSTPFNSLNLQANKISFGAFDFPDSLTEKMTNYRKLELDSNSTLSNTRDHNFSPYDGGYFIGNDSSYPIVGDQKVHFEVVEPATVSIVAQQVDNTFQSFTTSGGGDILLLEYGFISQESMFQTALESNAFLTWMIRIIGLLIMTIGLSMILKPLSVLADVLPILGNIVETGAGFIAFLISLCLTILTIAIAWLFFRPLIGGSLILMAGFVIWLIRNKVNKTDAKPSAQSASTA